ncbi:APC family permease [Paractinoplanes ferrugineus]|uniref:Amino acid permease n=1 Tax=Paractinoplanes ferrugineus TaxID=113564 RepID=A0A919MGD6_9ACTN|nr:APC family permease [Actinoplanes ferrugineus]GIE13744.1 amino acid permease [Actinoplanes ferrugineus]
MATTDSPAPEPALTLEPTPVGRPVADSLAGGTLGAAHLVFMVMAAVAPAAGAVALIPLSIALGVGVGTPGIFVVVALILLLFAVGFTRMVPYVRNAGAFYAFITRGLGGLAGLPAAYVALTAYLCVGTATLGALGYFANVTIDRFFGIDVPWWLCCAVAMVIVGLLGYLRITVAAGVLGAALLAEALAVLVLDVGILFQKGAGAFTLQSFAPSHVLAGSVGVGLIYGFSCFQGFEGTAIYAEEARDPDRTVPRATYGAVLLVGLFFVLTTWALIAGGGGEGAPAAALADPGNFAFGLSDTFVGHAWTDLLQVLIVTSSFAGVLAFHNAASRYLYALSRDGFMPRVLARTHPRHRSPTVAGYTSFAVMTGIMVGFAVAGLDPLTNLSTSLTGVGAVGILGLITATSLAVLIFFLRRRQYGWGYTVAPALATLGVGAATVLALSNYEAITGTTSTLINSLPWLHLVVIVAALAIGLWARSRRPARYAAMGATRIAE